MIDAIYCVSLSRLPERRKAVLKDLAPFQDVCDVYIFDAIDWKDFSVENLNDEEFYLYDSWNIPNSPVRWWNQELRSGSICNLLGHYSIWKHISENYNQALILEDDINFYMRPNYQPKAFVGRLQYVSKFMIENDCDIFYLGCWPVNKVSRVSSQISKCNYTYNSHAYIVSKYASIEMINSGIRKNLITTDEFITSTYCEHPREDIRNLYTNKKLNAYTFNYNIVGQRYSHRPAEIDKSEVEMSDFVL